MPSNYDKTDLAWTWCGDYLPSKDGDFADTFDDKIQSLVQEIQTVVQSSLLDWEEHPGLGSGLDEFIGEPNTKVTANRLRTRVRDSLILFNVVRDSDLDIKVIPVGIHAVLLLIKVAALATSENSLAENIITVSVVFDYLEKGIFFIESPEVV